LTKEKFSKAKDIIKIIDDIDYDIKKINGIMKSSLVTIIDRENNENNFDLLKWEICPDIKNQMIKILLNHCWDIKENLEKELAEL